MKSSVFFIEGYGKILTAKAVEIGISPTALSKIIGLTYEGTRQVLKENGSPEAVYKVCEALKVKMKSIMKKDII